MASPTASEGTCSCPGTSGSNIPAGPPRGQARHHLTLEGRIRGLAADQRLLAALGWKVQAQHGPGGAASQRPHLPQLGVRMHPANEGQEPQLALLAWRCGSQAGALSRRGGGLSAGAFGHAWDPMASRAPCSVKNRAASTVVRPRGVRGSPHGAAIQAG